MKVRMIVLFLASAAVLALVIPGLLGGLRVTRYAVDAGSIAQPVRIALVTDLHSCAYGTGERELLDAIDAEAPDLVLLGGDIFDDTLPDDNTEVFLAGIAGKYPCWYVTGNHEHRSGEHAFAAKMDILARLGIQRLSGATVAVEANGQRFTLCGVDDPRAWQKTDAETDDSQLGYETQLKQVAEQADPDSYTVLLAHRPEFAGLYSRLGFDLVLSGHAHGGQWRIPGLLNGLYAPNQGLFPRYAGGRYALDGTTLIVSRGLARESTLIPRLYNRPELVIVELR